MGSHGSFLGEGEAMKEVAVRGNRKGPKRGGLKGMVSTAQDGLGSRCL